MFRRKFWLALVLTIPTVTWGHILMRLTGWQAPAFPGSEWIAPVLGTVVFFYGGLVFLRGAWREIQDRLPDMMTLISLAITVAFVFSAAVTLGYPGMPLWEELATLVTIMLLGHWMEMRSIQQAQVRSASWRSSSPRPLRGSSGTGQRRSRSPTSARATWCWCARSSRAGGPEGAGGEQRGQRVDAHG